MNLPGAKGAGTIGVNCTRSVAMRFTYSSLMLSLTLSVSCSHSGNKLR